MNFWLLFQIIINLVFFAFLVAVWIRLSRPQKDDPRMSRGLQILQTKISILEDLSDRTETQVGQLTSLMELKVKEIQEKILQADKQIQSIDASMGKSIEVAKIFQDRIPHQEIIDRQNTIKYVKAARLAHQGLSVDEISKQIDLNIGELDFIAKVNKNQLQFSEEGLPDWAKEKFQDKGNVHESEVVKDNAVLELPLAKDGDQKSLVELGEKFRRAIDLNSTQSLQTIPAQTVPAPEAQSATSFANNSKGKQVEIKKVVFPRVNINDTLS